jgi:predicted O-linked N-acetylglucosamine transferase (SPINDLY family)
MVFAEALKDLGARLAGLVLGRDSLAGILINRGNALRDLKRPHDALAAYDRALRLKPHFAEALNNRGKTLLDLGRLDEALASHDGALRMRPDYAEAFYNRGNVLLYLKRLEDALASYERALQLKTDYADAHYNCGLVLQKLRRPEDALASYDRALQLKPDDAEALNNRGNVLIDLKQPELAVASYERALSHRPGYANACYNLGLALIDVGRPEEAVPCFAQVLELAQDYPFAKGKLLHAKMLCCDWAQLPQLRDSIEADIGAGKTSAEPFEYQAISGSAQNARLCAEMYAAANFPPAKVKLWAGERYGNQRIRIGYLSGEFLEHATAILITGLLERHDKTRFEVFAFDNGWDDASEIRGRINRAFDEIVNITRLEDSEAAAAIREKKVDILVDLNGYVGRERQGIFCYKPCPIQVNYLGFPGTLGADYFDYILADPHVLPPHHEAFYNEKVVYLPDTYQVNDSKRRIAQRIPTRAEVGLPETGFVFCCFNKNYKITPEVFAVWTRLLREVGGSVLWLLEDNLAASRNLKREAEQRGIAPDRLVFAARMKSDEHLSRHRLADLFLDTLPINAHTTASDSLWAGLPVLTCMGNTFPGRVAGSLLNAVGLPELITHDLESYEARALELASTPALLSDIRARLARNRTSHPLFDTDRFRRHIESAYVTMWERVERGEPPSSFAVAPIS